MAEQRGILIGTAVEPLPLRADADYAQTIPREFNLLTSENVLKMGPLRPDLLTYYFQEADFLVDFAESNGMKVRGHTLVWHNQLPEWLTNRTYSPSEMTWILNDHITTVMDHYKGRIWAWDVVNEAVLDDGSLRPTVFLQALGPEYIEKAFRWAHAADPDALLFYNDYGAEGLNEKSDAIYTLVKDLVERDVPIDGVGLQMHVDIAFPPNPADVAANILRLSALGLQVQITEMDVVTSGDPADAERQAEIYAEMLQVCLEAPACTAFETWGFTDRYTWQGTQTAPLLFDAQYQPKLAYFALRDVLSRPTP
ncbi:endo-1,4-beta-xylanase [Aggregatilinea lenta]|uniref:endo-1,4-beta-xylanase n=1 Tax=Aggregatilinea lenta TaxID=913108 RepID=UPI001EE83610|nr:endo-1,4-beta-xylanase [Aggregatilinea lenta]